MSDFTCLSLSLLICRMGIIAGILDCLGADLRKGCRSMLHSIQMGDPRNETVSSLSSQVAEAVLGSKSPGYLIWLATSRTLRSVRLKHSWQEWAIGCGVVTPFSFCTVSAAVPHHSPGRKSGQGSLYPFPCKQTEAQRGSVSSIGSHSKLMTA